MSNSRNGGGKAFTVSIAVTEVQLPAPRSQGIMPNNNNNNTSKLLHPTRLDPRAMGTGNFHYSRSSSQQVIQQLWRLRRALVVLSEVRNIPMRRHQKPKPTRLQRYQHEVVPILWMSY
jgi:hypothetical protein